MNTVARLPGNADSKGLMRSIEFGGFVLRAEHGRSPKPSCPKPQDHKASADLHRGMYFCVHVLVLCISVCVVRNDFISLFGKHARTSDFYLSTFHAQNSLMCVMDDISQDAYLCLASGFHARKCQCSILSGMLAITMCLLASLFRLLFIPTVSLNRICVSPAWSQRETQRVQAGRHGSLDDPM